MHAVLGQMADEVVPVSHETHGGLGAARPALLQQICGQGMAVLVQIQGEHGAIPGLASGDAILEGHQDAVSALAFEPGGTRLATGSKDGVLRIFSGPSWRLTDTLRGHDAPIKALAWGPEGRLATLDESGWLRTWDPATAAGPVLKHGAFTWALALSPDGSRAALSGSPGLIRIFDTATGRETPAAGVGRTPTLHGKIDSAGTADRAVAHGAGAGRTP